MQPPRDRTRDVMHFFVFSKEDGAPLDGVRLWKKNAASSLMHRLSDQNHADVHYHTFKYALCTLRGR